MSEYAKNTQTIEDMWKKRIELRDEGERMSIRSITVQYIGNVLFLPKLERDVKLVVERDYGTADPDKRFVMERTCYIVKASRKYVLSDGTELFEDGCSECNAYLSEDDNYCSNCGSRVVE